MRCPTCHAPVPLLGYRRPWRALWPRCRRCGTLALTAWHRLALFLLAILATHLAVGWLPGNITKAGDEMVAYAVYTGDEHYHLLRRDDSGRTLCGLPTLRRKRLLGEAYRPPARVTVNLPRLDQYSPCPRCTAASEESESKSGGRGGVG